MEYVKELIKKAKKSLNEEGDAYSDLLKPLIDDLEESLKKEFQVTSIDKIIDGIDLPDSLMSKMEDIERAM